MSSKLLAANVKLSNAAIDSEVLVLSVELWLDKAWIRAELDRFKPDPNQPPLFDKETQ